MTINTRDKLINGLIAAGIAFIIGISLRSNGVKTANDYTNSEIIKSETRSRVYSKTYTDSSINSIRIEIVNPLIKMDSMLNIINNKIE